MVDGEQLREAMRRFAAPIAVVTVVADGRELGVTVGSFGSLSLEPALAGVSIGLGSPLHEPLRQLGRFSASLLAGDQGAVAQHFARGVPPIALWSGVARHPSEVPEPLLEGALAWLECRVEHECEAGDHTVFVARVLSIELGSPGPPLVYVDGGYRSL